MACFILGFLGSVCCCVFVCVVVLLPVAVGGGLALFVDFAVVGSAVLLILACGCEEVSFCTFVKLLLFVVLLLLLELVVFVVVVVLKKDDTLWVPPTKEIQLKQ